VDPLRIAIANDYEIVVEGLVQMLKPFEDRVTVVETVANEPVSQDVDIVLYDNFGQAHHKGLDIDVLLSQARAKHLVVYTWHIDPALVDIALDIGATGYLPKNLTADELVSALERIHGGEVVAPETSPDPQPGSGDWPGRTLGLSERESEIIALITQGLTNEQIADRAYLSINTVKSYIRTAYRKMGVRSRSQAVLWGIDHGFRPDRARHRVPDDET
jgi:DNA-binding NarL/FixJ family response regulator